jgi:hypothetical protein
VICVISISEIIRDLFIFIGDIRWRIYLANPRPFLPRVPLRLARKADHIQLHRIGKAENLQYHSQ